MLLNVCGGGEAAAAAAAAAFAVPLGCAFGFGFFEFLLPSGLSGTFRRVGGVACQEQDEEPPQAGSRRGKAPSAAASNCHLLPALPE